MTELTEFAKEIDQFLQTDVVPHLEGWERANSYPIRDLIATLGQRQVFARCYTSDKDDPARFQYNRVLHERLAYLPSGILGSCVNNHLDAALSLVANHAKGEEMAVWRDDCVQGRRVITLASTERQTGSDIGAIETTVVEQDGGYRLSGHKWFISNGAVADGYCVLARTGAGTGVFDYSLFLVPRLADGVKTEALHTMGLRAGTIGAMTFDNVRLEKWQMVGVKGMGVPLTLKQFEKERLTLAIRLRSNSLYHLDLLKSHLREDRARRTGTSQLSRIESRMAEHYCELDRIRVYIDHVIDQRFRKKQVANLVASLKVQATRTAKGVAATLMQYFDEDALAEHGIAARFLRDVKASSMSGGSDEMMLTVIDKL